ncbi:DUF5060 domain-containing protein [Spirosoma utsteinense]|uniref:DUF5060 domain-containing protein n=1 Tax=Spirosoma utsteinense TaxID=2585773 RepID=A0ABR6W7C6_9BACT|nr:DUF5060 domain-containing protein [Spirosoma utsteinense]MBC3784920.1 hypothetical protein [Spirosoma utsteinense]MBC3792481.1 hypothetical protein [Spirosoma utsteinense]
MRQSFCCLRFILLLAATPTLLLAQRPSFTLNHNAVETFDYAVITVNMPPAKSGNPVEDVLITGMFISQTNDTSRVDGYCDSSDGSIHRIRFMPIKPGAYRFAVKSYAIYRRQIKNVLTTGRAQTGSYFGTFTATAEKRRGTLTIDSKQRYSIRPVKLDLGADSLPAQRYRHWPTNR